MGQKMVDLGFDVCLNPFGTLYNPVSVCNSVARLTSGIPFSKDECVQMGAGAGLVCSFSHHTSFARRTEDEFLQVANASLKEASLRWKAASKVIITLGTAWIYEYLRSGETVSSPMPGTILDVKVAAGQAVKSGDILFILEAMKMENEIFAPCDGTVSSVAVSKGAAVNPGDVLCVIG